MARKSVKGEGTISKRPNGSYEFKKVIHYGNTSKRVTVYGKTEQICLQKMQLKERELTEQSHFTSSQLLAEAMLDWIENVHGHTVKQQTKDRLIRTAKQIGKTDLGHKFINEVNSRDIQDYIQVLVDKEYSYSTVKKNYDLFNAYYRYASAFYDIKNPMLLVTMPRVGNIKVETREIEWFEQVDIDRFIMACGTRLNNGKLKYKYSYALAANIYLGLRGGELLALQWKDIDFNKGTIYISKTLVESRDKNGKTTFYVQNSTKRDKNRYVPMNTKAKTYLQQHKKESEFTDRDDFVISTSNRKTNTLKNLSDMIGKLEEEGGTSVKAKNTHVLRHTCASLYFRAGVPIEIICTILGNSREVCEKTYVHFAEEQLKNAAEMTIKAIEF